MEPSTSYGSLPDKYVAPYSNSSLNSSAYAPGMPAVASAARYTYANARPFEHAFSSGAARITERPRESRPSVAPTLALPPSASIPDSAAASPLVLAASVATLQALQASHAALQVAAYGSSATPTQAPPGATQSTPLPILRTPPAEKCPRPIHPRPEARAMQLSRLADLQTTRTTILIKRNAITRSTSNAKVNS